MPVNARTIPHVELSNVEQNVVFAESVTRKPGTAGLPPDAMIGAAGISTNVVTGIQFRYSHVVLQRQHADAATMSTPPVDCQVAVQRASG